MTAPAATPNTSADPWLSVLMPAHNAQLHLQAALESVMSQLSADAEIIILDDGSTDATPQILASWAAYPQVRLLANPSARGVSVSRNRLLDEARGQWLWFMDADDLMRPGALQRVRRVVDAQPAIDAVLLDYAVLRERSGLKHRLRGEAHRRTFAGTPGLVTDSPALCRGLAERGQWHLWSKVVRRAAWPAHLRCPEGRVFEDLAVAPRLAAGWRSAWVLGEPLIDYRSNPHSILGRMDAGKVQDWALALQELASTLPADPDGAATWSELLARQWVRMGKVALRVGLSPEWVMGQYRALVATRPPVEACTNCWWRQPSRWGVAWSARQLRRGA